jgi:hypothetical protein
MPMGAAPEAQAPRPLSNAEEKADVLDMLRQSRQRLRGRSNGRREC